MSAVPAPGNKVGRAVETLKDENKKLRDKLFETEKQVASLMREKEQLKKKLEYAQQELLKRSENATDDTSDDTRSRRESTKVNLVAATISKEVLMFEKLISKAGAAVVLPRPDGKREAAQSVSHATGAGNSFHRRTRSDMARSTEAPSASTSIPESIEESDDTHTVSNGVTISIDGTKRRETLVSDTDTGEQPEEAQRTLAVSISQPGEAEHRDDTEAPGEQGGHAMVQSLSAGDLLRKADDRMSPMAQERRGSKLFYDQQLAGLVASVNLSDDEEEDEEEEDGDENGEAKLDATEETETGAENEENTSAQEAQASSQEAQANAQEAQAKAEEQAKAEAQAKADAAAAAAREQAIAAEAHAKADAEALRIKQAQEEEARKQAEEKEKAVDASTSAPTVVTGDVDVTEMRGGSVSISARSVKSERDEEEKAMLQVAEDLKLAQEKLPMLITLMEKQSPNFMRSWQRRYVAVYDYNIYYSKAAISSDDVSEESERKAPRDEPVHCLPLVVVNAIKTDSTRTFSVQAQDPKSGALREYKFRANTNQERDLWVKGLNEHRNHLLSMLRWVSLNKSNAVEVSWN